MKKAIERKQITAMCAVLLLATLTACSLVGCRYEEPDLSEYEEEHAGGDKCGEARSPYGMYDYSKSAYFSILNENTIYKGDVYYLDNSGLIRYVPLNSLDYDLRYEGALNPSIPENFSICPDNSHDHDRAIKSECPAYIGYNPFVLDAYESGGDYPIIYYSTDRYGEYNEEGMWERVEGYHIFRYDSGKVERELILTLKDWVRAMVAYGERLFILTTDADNDYTLHSVTKDGKQHRSTIVGEGQLKLIDVYGERVIVRDGDGTIYSLSFDLQSCEEIYQIEDDLTLSGIEDFFKGAFIYDDYLYYVSDFEVTEYYPYKDDPINNPEVSYSLLGHSLRRLPMGDLTGEGELVAQNIYDGSMFGIVDNVFYYVPCEPGEKADDCHLNFTGGLLKGVDLETLQPIEMKEDIGLFITNSDCQMSGNAIIGGFFEIKDILPYDFQPDELVPRDFYYLYDYKTGAIYPLRSR